jgi:hypothetical protein
LARLEPSFRLCGVRPDAGGEGRDGLPDFLGGDDGGAEDGAGLDGVTLVFARHRRETEGRESW